MKELKKLEAWHQTRKGRATFAILELVALYVAISKSIDSGSLWWYGLSLILLIGFVRNVVLFIKKK